MLSLQRQSWQNLLSPNVPWTLPGLQALLVQVALLILPLSNLPCNMWGMTI